MGCASRCVCGVASAAAAAAAALEPHVPPRPPLPAGALSSHSVAIASGAGGGGGGNHWHIAPLHWAAWQGDAARVSVLLATGRADIEELDEQDRDGWSALHFAVRGRSAACLDLLLGAGADPGRRDAAHGTPLHLAAAAGSAECVAALLRRGACPAVEGKDGRTPLHEAAMRGHAGCVAALLAAGGTRTLGMKDGHGSTAAQYAEQHLARLQAAEQRAPYQQPADRLRDALEAAALLRKAAAGAGARGPPAKMPSVQSADKCPAACCPALGSQLSLCHNEPGGSLPALPCRHVVAAVYAWKGCMLCYMEGG
ncbi:hypothetical protein CHLNCDRAFT_51747 [Chlorella variabilis]|uniref:Uncharacterized protein n=1 Tax=Chlorella variabilis TaxID=554065 RepID=E1ZCX2_CHLVA|nr:hypothetical protein CHLNCDRAFT_51747 [Chlorella variabilis]EFN56314.1 hypothetical protein CHLNCDRAFT_51747 [Chlorella variabilis]|eukprot:XP_005848416.1 hypothetical protein CHLNCDRAFT_51747 [Chlorella variabilis]